MTVQAGDVLKSLAPFIVVMEVLAEVSPAGLITQHFTVKAQHGSCQVQVRFLIFAAHF